MAAFLKPAFVFLLSAATAGSCQKASNGGADCSCRKDIACTMDFRSIQVRVRDAAGAPVTLDSVYTVRKATGEILRANEQMPADPTQGRYTVLADGGTGAVCGEDFEVRGFKGGTQVLTEPYRIRFDCCHVERVSGKEEVVL